MSPETRGLIAVFTCSTDPARAEETLRWENETVQKLLQSKVDGLVDARRYQFRDWTAPKPEGFNWTRAYFDEMHRGRTVTLYETDTEELKPLAQRIDAALDRGPDCLQVVRKGSYRFQIDLHPPGFDRAAKHDTNGVFLALLAPRDEKPYEAWYVSTHLDDEIRHGVNHSVTRFLAAPPYPGPKSFTILETDWRDITKARDHIATFMPQWRYPPGITDTFEIAVAGEYQRIV